MATHAWFTVCRLRKTFVKSFSASTRSHASFSRFESLVIPLNGLRSFGGSVGLVDESIAPVSWRKFSSIRCRIQSPMAHASPFENLARLNCSTELSSPPLPQFGGGREAEVVHQRRGCRTMPQSPQFRGA